MTIETTACLKLIWIVKIRVDCQMNCYYREFIWQFNSHGSKNLFSLTIFNFFCNISATLDIHPVATFGSWWSFWTRTLNSLAHVEVFMRSFIVKGSIYFTTTNIRAPIFQKLPQDFAIALSGDSDKLLITNVTLTNSIIFCQTEIKFDFSIKEVPSNTALWWLNRDR